MSGAKQKPVTPLGKHRLINDWVAFIIPLTGEGEPVCMFHQVCLYSFDLCTSNKMVYRFLGSWQQTLHLHSTFQILPVGIKRALELERRRKIEGLGALHYQSIPNVLP